VDDVQLDQDEQGPSGGSDTEDEFEGEEGELAAAVGEEDPLAGVLDLLMAADDEADEEAGLETVELTLGLAEGLDGAETAADGEEAEEEVGAELVMFEEEVEDTEAQEERQLFLQVQAQVQAEEQQVLRMMEQLGANEEEALEVEAQLDEQIPLAELGESEEQLGGPAEEIQLADLGDEEEEEEEEKEEDAFPAFMPF